ncbi:peptide-methionine (S)-S-oxide reductase MsrA [Perlucidibaca aquatica]|uniref:peptide-methionine (S)-S-oxide reductase MsrA n=1 Tax=Perlucidibaca aquatica TaxID=1852776 RepID=UPI000839E4E2|nr:peptide-methionine (S)-S-oxide reductase MsrA [Perlucidibaca aquatica]
MKEAQLILGGGCFWCLDAVYREVPGVLECTSGYAGGARPNPSYEQICSGATGHAEVVKLRFDADQTSLERLLEIFFTIHDPTTLNRQGADTGTQYRSVIFCGDDAQRVAVEAFIEQLKHAQLFDNPIVTEVSPAVPFYDAEEYHQDYFRRNPGQGYCHMVVSPKVAKYRKLFGPGADR